MTTGSSRRSSRPAGAARAALRGGAALTAVLAAACVEERPGLSGTTSLRVVITAPTDLGSHEARLADDARTITVDVTALDEKGQPDPSFEATVDVYTHFLGTLSPERGGVVAPPSIELRGGVAEGVTLELERAFGETFLWVEDVGGDAPTFATGASPTLWYRDPYLEDVSRPPSESATNALERSPLEGKQVRISASKHGASGRLIVTGVYAQGFTISDVNCAPSPCVAEPYNHLFVYTFNRPRAEDGTSIQVGQVVSALAGGVGEFNGFTELNFPQTWLASPTPSPGDLPEPVVLDPMWLASPSGPTGMINLEKVESALVAVEGAVMCDVDDPENADEWNTYAQWKLDVGFGCSRAFNVITKGAISEFDPRPYKGRTIPRVVGTLRAVNIGTFHVWIIHPRYASDLTLPPLP